MSQQAGDQAGGTSRKPAQQPQVWRSSIEPQEILEPRKGLESGRPHRQKMETCRLVEEVTTLAVPWLCFPVWTSSSVDSGSRWSFLTATCGTRQLRVGGGEREDSPGHTVSEREGKLGRSYSVPIRQPPISAQAIIVNMILINLSSAYYTI